MDIESDKRHWATSTTTTPWEDGADAVESPGRQKSDFYRIARPETPDSQVEDQFLFALTGRRGSGTTTLLHEFVRYRIEAGDPPELFLYRPFDADPLCQLQSATQFRRAVRYYESRILGRIDTDRPQFVLLDDVHRIEHPDKPSTEGWGGPVAELYAETTDRHAVVTASAAVQIEREFANTNVPETEYDIQSILPETFRDCVFALSPELEEGDAHMSPTSLRAGERSISTALDTGDVEPLLAELRAKHGRSPTMPAASSSRSSTTSRWVGSPVTTTMCR